MSHLLKMFLQGIEKKKKDLTLEDRIEIHSLQVSVLAWFILRHSGIERKDVLLLQNCLFSGIQTQHNKHLSSNVIIHNTSLHTACSENAQRTQAS